MSPEELMRQALALAQEARDAGEIPVGCLITDGEGSVIAVGRNRREERRDATAHAEVEAIRAACEQRGDWHLDDCTLYVTLEPCPMCAGACMNARIRRVFFGAADPKAGAYGSVFDLNAFPLNHHPAVEGGVLGEECAALLRDFFADLRTKK